MRPAHISSDAELLDHIRKLPHARANLKQLIRELGARRGARETLEATLARLAARGDLIALRSDQWVAADGTREFATGRVQMHRNGYGFVVPDRRVEGLDGDVFLPPADRW